MRKSALRRPWAVAAAGSIPTNNFLVRDPPAMRIAILEDDADQAALIKSHLTSIAHDCYLFEAGRALIHAAGRESFDLFLLDWQVPDLSGEEVLKWIRAHVAAPVPITRSGSAERSPQIPESVVESMVSASSPCSAAVRPCSKQNASIRNAAYGESARFGLVRVPV